MADDTEDITTTFLNMIEECYESSGFADSPTALKAYYLCVSFSLFFFSLFGVAIQFHLTPS
jgi:hypothetical protein